MTIAPGDYVRSFHFPDNPRDLDGERACYVEGRVLEIGRFDFPDCDRYKIAVEREVFGGVEQPTGSLEEFVYPPVNGTRRLFSLRGPDVTDGVERIEGPKGQ